MRQLFFFLYERSINVHCYYLEVICDFLGRRMTYDQLRAQTEFLTKANSNRQKRVYAENGAQKSVFIQINVMYKRYEFCRNLHATKVQ